MPSKGDVWQANLSLIFTRTIPIGSSLLLHYLRRLRRKLFWGRLPALLPPLKADLRWTDAVAQAAGSDRLGICVLDWFGLVDERASAVRPKRLSSCERHGHTDRHNPVRSTSKNSVTDSVLQHTAAFNRILQQHYCVHRNAFVFPKIFSRIDLLLSDGRSKERRPTRVA